MKVINIYEPAMCCSSGVCGVSVDTELLRVTGLAKQLNKMGIILGRFNLSEHPMAFVENKEINMILNEKGTEILPVTVIGDQIVKTGGYPTNKEVESYLEIKLIEALEMNVESDCCAGGGCC